MTQPTRADVAKLAGVSAAVVSYVMNGGPRPVSDRSRRKVTAAIRELGYRPNQVARALRGTRSSSVGLLLPDAENPFFWELAQAIEAECITRGYVLFVGTTGNDPLRERHYLDTFEDRQVDGVIVVSAATDGTETKRLTLPTVYVDRTPNEMPESVAHSDGVSGSKLAVEHLLQVHGCRRLLLLAGPEGMEGTSLRHEGAMAAVAAEPDARAVVRYGAFSLASGRESMARAFADGLDVDAVFAFSDVQTIGALRACADAGVRVPEDIAVISFDGTGIGRYLHPTLTAVVQDVRAMATSALNGLQSQLEDPGEPRDSAETSPVTLRLGESCGCSSRVGGIAS